MPGLRWPKAFRTVRFRRFLALTALATLGAWWSMDQPRRKDKAMATARRVGGVVRHDIDDPTVVPAPPPRKTRSPRTPGRRRG